MTARRLERLAPLLLPLLALPALWHFLTHGLPQHSADGLLHLFRLALLDKQVSAGMLYPRWMPELVLGRGYPLLNFYGPASYYLALIFRIAGLSLAPSLIAAFAVLIVLAGAGAYLLARDLFPGKSPLAALVSGVAYMYAPYLLTNVYIRGAIAEVAAQALLPWIFWSTGRLMTRRREPDAVPRPRLVEHGRGWQYRTTSRCSFCPSHGWRMWPCFGAQPAAVATTCCGRSPRPRPRSA